MSTESSTFTPIGGGEYFSQEGELVAGKDRSLGELGKFCVSLSPKIKHTVTPVESKEKITEVCFRGMLETADTLLCEARLSTVFWCGAVIYFQYCYNRMLNYHSGPSAPYQMLTGKRARWNKICV